MICFIMVLFATSRKPFRSRMISTGLKLIAQLDVLLRPEFNCSTWQKMQISSKRMTQKNSSEGAWVWYSKFKMLSSNSSQMSLQKNYCSRSMRREKSESLAILQSTRSSSAFCFFAQKSEAQAKINMLFIWLEVNVRSVHKATQIHKRGRCSSGLLHLLF